MIIYVSESKHVQQINLISLKSVKTAFKSPLEGDVLKSGHTWRVPVGSWNNIDSISSLGRCADKTVPLPSFSVTPFREWRPLEKDAIKGSLRGFRDGARGTFSPRVCTDLHGSFTFAPLNLGPFNYNG